MYQETRVMLRLDFESENPIRFNREMMQIDNLTSRKTYKQMNLGQESVLTIEHKPRNSKQVSNSKYGGTRDWPSLLAPAKMTRH